MLVLVMLFGLIKPSEYGYLLSYISPGFLDVVPPNKLLQAIRDLALKGRNRSQFKKWMSDRTASLKLAKLPIRIADRKGADTVALPGTVIMTLSKIQDAHEKRIVGENILRLFFHQIFDGGATLLDLRSDTFGSRVVVGSIDDLPSEDRELVWAPRCLFVTWQRTFIQPIRRLYWGFYQNDTAQFDLALGELNLEPTRDVLLEFFGNARDQDMIFERAAFLDQFKRVFTICKKEKRSIHPQFVVLGAYLAGLYDALEQLNTPINVGSVFRDLISDSTFATSPIASERI